MSGRYSHSERTQGRPSTVGAMGRSNPERLTLALSPSGRHYVFAVANTQTLRF